MNIRPQLRKEGCVRLTDGGKVRDHKSPLHDCLQRAASELIMEEGETVMWAGE